MWTRRQWLQFQIATWVAFAMLALQIILQLGGWVDREAAKIVAVVAIGLFILWGLFILSEYRRLRIFIPLSVGHIAGGMSVEPATPLYEWDATIPLQNRDDERSVITKEVYLMVRCGKWVMRLYPKEPQEVIFGPKEPKTLVFHFESVGRLGPSSGERETNNYECTAVIVIVDSNDNRVERPLGAGTYQTNI